MRANLNHEMVAFQIKFRFRQDDQDKKKEQNRKRRGQPIAIYFTIAQRSCTAYGQRFWLKLRPLNPRA